MEKEKLYGETDDLDYLPSGDEGDDQKLEDAPQASSEARRAETERAAAQTRKSDGAVPASLQRPAKSITWEQRKGTWQKKREAETEIEDLRTSSEPGPKSLASGSAGPAAPLSVELPADLPASTKAMEDLVDRTLGPAPGTSKPADIGEDVNSIDLGALAEPVRLGSRKAEFLELAALDVGLCFHRQGVDITDQEARQIAALQIELAGCHVLE